MATSDIKRNYFLNCSKAIFNIMNTRFFQYLLLALNQFLRRGQFVYFYLPSSYVSLCSLNILSESSSHYYIFFLSSKIVDRLSLNHMISLIPLEIIITCSKFNDCCYCCYVALDQCSYFYIHQIYYQMDYFNWCSIFWAGCCMFFINLRFVVDLRQNLQFLK